MDLLTNCANYSPGSKIAPPMGSLVFHRLMQGKRCKSLLFRDHCVNQKHGGGGVNFVDYDFLKLNYIRNKMTHVSPLAMGALAYKSLVTSVALKTIKILWCKY